MSVFSKEHLIWLIRDDVQQYWTAETGPFARGRLRYWAYRVPISNCIRMLIEDHGMTPEQVTAAVGTRQEILALNLGECP